MMSIIFSGVAEDESVLFAEPERGSDGRYDYGNQRVYALNLHNGEVKLLIDGFGESYIAQTGGYIYYLKKVETPEYLGYCENNKKDIFNLSGGVVWRMDIETGKEEKFIEAPEYYLRGVSAEAVGRHIVFDYGAWGEEMDRDGTVLKTYKAADGGKLVIDTRTGEYRAYPRTW